MTLDTGDPFHCVSSDTEASGSEKTVESTDWTNLIASTESIGPTGAVNRRGLTGSRKYRGTCIGDPRLTVGTDTLGDPGGPCGPGTP